MVQGYLISKPLPLEQFIVFQKQQSVWSSFPIGLVHMAIIDRVQWRRPQSRQGQSTARSCAKPRRSQKTPSGLLLQH
jgi:hypothetical protein